MHCSGTHVRALIKLQEYPQHAEADTRIILHIYWALCESLDSIIILSNDTDVLMLILRYVFYFLSIGLKHLFTRIGNANNMRYLPLHKLATALGERKCANNTENTLRLVVIGSVNWEQSIKH